MTTLLATIGAAAISAAPATAATRAEPATPVKLALVVAIASPARAAGLIPAKELEALTAKDGALTQALDAVGTKRVTLAIDPLIAASVLALGDEAPESATRWVDRLDAAPQDRFPLLMGDADPTLLRQAGATLPALGTVWTTPGTVSSADLGAFAAAGATRVLVSDADLGERPDPTTALASADGLSLAVIDDAVSDALAAAAAQPTASSLGTLRAAIAGEAGDRVSVVAGFGRATSDWTGLGVVLDSIGADLGLQLVGLDQLSGQTAEAALGEGQQPDDRVALLRQVVASEAADSAFATIAADPTRIREQRRLRTLLLASVAWDGVPAWTNAVEEAIERSRDLRASVRIIEADSLFLADRSSIPVTVANDLDQPVTVVVRARAATGRLDIDDTPVELEVPAGTRASVSLPASAVSNGLVAVTASLTAVDGTPIGTPTTANVNVQAGWETPIVAGAAAVLLLIIVLGIVRTVRRARRARRQEEPVEAANE